MITPGGNIRATESHLQGCDTVSAVRHEAVLFKGTTEVKSERCSREWTTNRMRDSEERGRRPSGHYNVVSPEQGRTE